MACRHLHHDEHGQRASQLSVPCSGAQTLRNKFTFSGQQGFDTLRLHAVGVGSRALRRVWLQGAVLSYHNRGATEGFSPESSAAKCNPFVQDSIHKDTAQRDKENNLQCIPSYLLHLTLAVLCVSTLHRARYLYGTPSVCEMHVINRYHDHSVVSSIGGENIACPLPAILPIPMCRRTA